MKTTIVPAQITTVEDKIAGNWTFNQIILLIIPLLTSTAVYVFMSPHSHLSTIKVALILLQFGTFVPLTIRINGKILGSWLIIYLGYKFRPKLYLFTKNDPYRREAVTAKKEVIKEVEKEVEKAEAVPPLSLKEQIKIDQLLLNKTFNIRFGMKKKGGINVSLSEQE